MIENPQIINTTAQATAYIHQTVPRSEIRNVMGPTLKELREALTAQGIKITGPWFTHHLRIEPGIFDFEICLPVSAVVQPVGRVKPGQWPAMKLARTVYQGNFDGLGSAWGEFDAWIKSIGHSAAVDLWERYLVGPETTSDPADWRTELNRPLID